MIKEREMKNLIVILMATLAIVIATPIVLAQHMHKEHQHGMGEAEKTEVAEEAIEVNNKICPVSGEEIKEDEVYKVEYAGKVYNLCCKMCAKDFKKDPQKYIKKLEEMEEEESHRHGHDE